MLTELEWLNSGLWVLGHLFTAWIGYLAGRIHESHQRRPLPGPYPPESV